MQLYVAYKDKASQYFGNFSGTGAGKTLSAVLASYAYSFMKLISKKLHYKVKIDNEIIVKSSSLRGIILHTQVQYIWKNRHLILIHLVYTFQSFF